MVNILNNKYPPSLYFRRGLCNKKVKHTPTTRFILYCRCKHHYCYKHIYPPYHNCTYDYKSKAMEKLKEGLPLVVADKVPNRI